MKRPLILSVLCAGILATPAIAGAVDASKFQLEVNFDRASLDDPSKIAAEYEDIRSQVSEKCAAENDGFNAIRKMIAVDKCERFTMRNTVRSINHDGLTKYHQSKKTGSA